MLNHFYYILFEFNCSFLTDAAVAEAAGLGLAVDCGLSTPSSQDLVVSRQTLHFCR